MNPPELYNAKYLLEMVLNHEDFLTEDMAEFLSGHLECYECPWWEKCRKYKDWHDRERNCQAKLVKFINKGEIEND